MTRVLHTGDTHLGYQQYHRPERRQDFLDAFHHVATDAVDLDVDAVVHAGDLFHDRRPGLPDLLGTLDILETLSQANIPFLGIVGNHESRRNAQWLDLFETMNLATRLTDTPTIIGDTAFYGLDYVPRTQRKHLEYEFDPHNATHTALVAHGQFEPLVPSYSNNEWDATQLLADATHDFDALLLADEHSYMKQEITNTWATYCGSTERVSTDERDARGYNLVEFNDTDGVHITRRGIQTREFIFLDLELAEDEGFNRVRDRLREHDITDAVVHVTLAGEGADISPARIEQFATDAGALVARVRDRRDIEITDESPIDVAFADPDQAVTDRVRDLGLSDAAFQLDETIRSNTIADSNVADEVERRITELLDESDAFDVDPSSSSSSTPARQEQTQPLEAVTSGEDAPASDGQPPEPTGDTDSEPTDEDDSFEEQPATPIESDSQASVDDYL